MSEDRKEYMVHPLNKPAPERVGGFAAPLSPAGTLAAPFPWLCPHLPPEDLKPIQLDVSKACDIAASASLSVLDDPSEEPAQSGQADLLGDAIFQTMAVAGLRKKVRGLLEACQNHPPEQWTFSHDPSIPKTRHPGRHLVGPDGHGAAAAWRG